MTEAPKPEWWFYHLSRTTLEQAAAPLMSKCLEVGWRVLAVSPHADRRAALDATLWTYDDTSLLPHGQAEALLLGEEGVDVEDAQNLARPKRPASMLRANRC